MTHDEMIAVIQAHKEGRTVQCKLNASGIVNQELIDRADKLLKERLVASGAAKYVKPAYDWSDKTCDLFDFVSYEYRVKPEPPKPREGFVYSSNILVLEAFAREFPGAVGTDRMVKVREVL